uniref:Uncharacterized protein n=1 Tax=Chromera velia CCMP2878 TaxID=1169474 RepID=A0A0G4FM85_9ALVE|mmetsp:Transcript_44368/g.87650  ORF Transcript_44368/g.87650 Transcript_44368/m.87650 type:complete len:686 (-) Transcript_44368:1013-3070(-)|eukprot:Cvel_17667.t1-p1 / transcript=Cvel_17667.t1 / gene=Cvel_17667 / organism=Chromera_velia_CCMP2878 / gene_product=hypothetical protein / transcript_product=hypothetical protein / location=Cvel_scaffold1424:5488-10334(-) / protein_length=685 / sequence_SO=supercontig / SO=protein_coding / is_pseudo=false
MRFTVSVLALLFGAVVAQEVNRPVSKVINLLKDMKTALEQEQEADEGTFDKFNCWCKKNKKEKEEGIATAEQRIKDIIAFVDQAAATIERLEAEIKTLEKEIADNNASLQEAAAIRQRELDEFRKEEAELTEAITALKGAITVLSKHHTPSPAAFIDIATVLKHSMFKLGSRISADDQKALSSFLQNQNKGPGYLGSSATFRGAYAPQSGVIFGILNNMKEEFAKDLSDAQAEEAKKVEEYEALKKAKLDEIAADTAAKTEKEAQLSDTREKLATSKADSAASREALAADQKFLQDIVLKCGETESEWEERQKTRAAEMAAVAKAISVLSSDDAHDLFTRTFNPPASLLQKRVTRKVTKYQAQSVSNLIKRTAKRVGGPHQAQLLQLSNSLSSALAPFTKLLGKIDGMISGLQEEKADEIKHRDWCLAMIHENEKDTMTAEKEAKDLEAKIASLKETIETLAGEIAVLEEEVKAAQLSIQQASEDREAENDEFKASLKDAQETQKLLQSAVSVLKAYYQPALLQKSAEPTGKPLTYDGAYESTGLEAAPEGFDPYVNNEHGHGVIAMIDGIITQSATLEKELVNDEQAAQVAYEEFVKDLNTEITTKEKAITEKSDESATAKADKNKTEEDLASTQATLAELAKYSADVHYACDFTIKNFDIRQAAFQQEIEALQQAKAILKGMQ